MSHYPSQPVGQPPMHSQSQDQSGMIGFILALVSYFTCLLLSPVAIYFSMKGLKNPQQQGFAIAGLILGILGTIGLVGVVLYILVIVIFFGGIMGLAIFGAAANSNANTNAQRTQRSASVSPTKEQVNSGQMQVLFTRVSGTIDARTVQLKRLPNENEGNDAIKQARIQDPWKKEVRFKPKGQFDYEMRSAGPDGVFNNADDIKRDGKLSAPLQHMITSQRSSSR